MQKPKFDNLFFPKSWKLLYFESRNNSNVQRPINPKKLNSVAFSPQANYTDRATAACRRS
jgi:hypothetical protein